MFSKHSPNFKNKSNFLDSWIYIAFFLYGTTHFKTTKTRGNSLGNDLDSVHQRLILFAFKQTEISIKFQRKKIAFKKGQFVTILLYSKKYDLILFYVVYTKCATKFWPIFDYMFPESQETIQMGLRSFRVYSFSTKLSQKNTWKPKCKYACS